MSLAVMQCTAKRTHEPEDKFRKEAEGFTQACGERRQGHSHPWRGSGYLCRQPPAHRLRESAGPNHPRKTGLTARTRAASVSRVVIGRLVRDARRASSRTRSPDSPAPRHYLSLPEEKKYLRLRLAFHAPSPPKAATRTLRKARGRRILWPRRKKSAELQLGRSPGSEHRFAPRS